LEDKTMLFVTPAPSPTDPDQLLTRHQIAQLLQTDPRTVDRMRADRVLNFPRPVILPGGQPRWKRGDILAWIDSQGQSLRKRPTA
jgi:predicted DNA-binding transcriptional regulator AlpA